MYKLVYVVLVAFIISSVATANTITTSGVLTNDEIWTGTVNILGDVTVPEGITLTIKPGTIVRFAARSDRQSGGGDPLLTELIVNGILVAQGTEDSMITFTSELEENPVPRDWMGIRFIDPDANTGSVDIVIDDSILDHCIIEYALYIYCRNYSPIIKDSIIRYSGGNGISCLNSSAIIKSNTITDNPDGAGIRLILSPATIDGNAITKNGVGIYMHCSGYPKVTNNIITNNTSYGIHISQSEPALGNLGNADKTDDGGNQIYDNGEYDIYYISAPLIKAEGNYWGTNNPDIIDSHIWDNDEGTISDDTGNEGPIGIVDFKPWLSSPTDVIPIKPTLYIIPANAPPGTSVTVEISIDDATGIAGGDILVNYDTNIMIIDDVRATDLISGINLIVNDTIPGKIILSMAGAQCIPEGSGALIEIDITVSPSVDIGTETTLDFGEATVYDELGVAIPINLESGTIEISGIRGDVNQDGLVRSNDAILTLRFIVGLDTLSEYQQWAADMNGDGNVESDDAILILYAASTMFAPSIQPVVHSGGHIAIVLAGAHDVTRGSMTIPLVVDNAAGLAGGDILISYDISSLKAVEVIALNDGLMAYNTSIPGIIRISFVGTNGSPDNTIAAITFNSLSDSFVKPIIKMVKLYDYNARPIDASVMRHHELLAKYTAAFQNYPNPFNPETWIPYQLVADSSVIIRIYSSSGQLVRTIDLGYKKAGVYVARGEAAHWDGTIDSGELAASGIYYYSIKAGEYIATRKMVVAR